MSRSSAWIISLTPAIVLALALALLPEVLASAAEMLPLLLVECVQDMRDRMRWAFFLSRSSHSPRASSTSAMRKSFQQK
jgi:hypothetical protein